MDFTALESHFLKKNELTYKFASTILKNTVNEAKEILKEFIKTKKDYTVTYIIGGITLLDKYTVTIVPNNKYDDVKKKFKKITIDHIYSVQNHKITDWIHVFSCDEYLYNINSVESSSNQLDKDVKPTVKQENNTVEEEPSTTKNVSVKSNVSQKNNSSKITSKQKKGSKGDLTKFCTPFAEMASRNVEQNKKSVTSNKKDLNDVQIKTELKEDSKVANSQNSDDEDDKKPVKKSPIEDSDDDIFDKSEHSDTESVDENVEEPVPMLDDSPSVIDDSVIAEKENNTKSANENEEVNSKPSAENTEDMMYTDDEGFFVFSTKKKNSKKNTVVEKEPPKKETGDKRSTDTPETEETAKKLKKNTNQNTLLSYFAKK